MNKFTTLFPTARTTGTQNICLSLDYSSRRKHYNDPIMSAMASQITSLTIVYSTVYSMRKSKENSKICVTSLIAGNSPVTGEFPAHKAGNAENISIWWRHHGLCDKSASRSFVWINGPHYNMTTYEAYTSREVKVKDTANNFCMLSILQKSFVLKPNDFELHVRICK